MLGFFVLQPDEIGVLATMGKVSRVVNPGPGFAFPIFQRVIKTKSSLQTIDLPDQQIVLSGNIAITISGNLNFRVVEPARALLGVSDYRYSMQQLALTTISDVLGTKTIEEVRTEKIRIADEIEKIVAELADKWGVGDVDIRLTDARMDESLLRAMMRETEARKEAEAVKIKAESDRYVATILGEAAETLGATPGAMTLRVLQTLNDVSNDKTTVVVPLPIELFPHLGAAGHVATEDSVDAPFVKAVESPDPVSSASADDAEQVPPLGSLKLSGDKILGVCPHCDTQFNVTQALSNMRYDRMPDVPGMQLRCAICSEIFTLPEVAKD